MMRVTADPDYLDGCYIIERERLYSVLGFDVTLDRLERYALDLYQQTEPVDALMDTMRPRRGELVVYQMMRDLERELVDRYERTGVRSVAELSPQLVGLEGWRVEVTRSRGERDRFIVGKSTGPIPWHLELKRVDSSGGGPADREYRSVKALERVR